MIVNPYRSCCSSNNRLAATLQSTGSYYLPAPIGSEIVHNRQTDFEAPPKMLPFVEVKNAAYLSLKRPSSNKQDLLANSFTINTYESKSYTMRDDCSAMSKHVRWNVCLYGLHSFVLRSPKLFEIWTPGTRGSQFR